MPGLPPADEVIVSSKEDVVKRVKEITGGMGVPAWPRALPRQQPRLHARHRLGVAVMCPALRCWGGSQHSNQQDREDWESQGVPPWARRSNDCEPEWVCVASSFAD